MGKYFGTDGFRGEVNVDLTTEHAFLIGKYLGLYLDKTMEHRPKIVIGKDTRRSGDMLESAIIAGLTSTGADAFLLGVTTTPSVSYVTRTEDFDLGIMISASHNPFYDNGIKLIDWNGKKLNQNLLDEIEVYMDSPRFDINVKGENIGVVHDYSKGREHYVNYLSKIPKNKIEGLKIVLDLANGASSSLAKEVYGKLDINVSVINDQPDGVNINVECGSTHIQTLQDYVIENQMDIGFAFDGDADRCIAVDHTGKEINGDLILFVVAQYLKERNNLKDNTLVLTEMSNMGVLDALKQQDLSLVVTHVGDKNVAKEIHQNNYSLGGEQSGHIIFSEHSTTGDGILTSLMILETLMTTKTTLHEKVKNVAEYPQVLKNIKVKNKYELLENVEFKNVIKDMQEELGKNGRIFIRPSGTEPLIRVMIEAKDTQLVKHYINKAEEIVNSFI